MTPEERLAQLADALGAAGVDALVMGGHAVRYYGVDRNTVDFDFYASSTSADQLRQQLAHSALLRGAREGPSWRPDEFARFEVGKLPDGREEWLEFWIRNHLLDRFHVLRDRQERGPYGGREIAFISLPDLLDSKETERESDWQDIALLEEIYDARNLGAANTHQGVATVLATLRSRRGFERALTMNLFADRAMVQSAMAACHHPVTFAFLLPLIPEVNTPASLRAPIDPAVLEMLCKVQFNGPKHQPLVEVVRRGYKRAAMEKDRLDKQSRF